MRVVGRRCGRARDEAGGEGAVFVHAIPVAADIDDVAVVEQPVDQSAGHDGIPEDRALRLEAFVDAEHRRRVLVAATHQLRRDLAPTLHPIVSKNSSLRLPSTCGSRQRT